MEIDAEFDLAEVGALMGEIARDEEAPLDVDAVDFDVADASPTRYFVIVRGRLASTDLDTNRTAHDMVAAGGEADVRMAGDLAHVVYLGLEDQREFLAIDIWDDDTNIMGVYSNPDFAMAFGMLVEGMPVLGVYESTDWEQW